MALKAMILRSNTASSFEPLRAPSNLVVREAKPTAIERVENSSGLFLFAKGQLQLDILTFATAVSRVPDISLSQIAKGVENGVQTDPGLSSRATLNTNDERVVAAEPMYPFWCSTEAFLNTLTSPVRPFEQQRRVSPNRRRLGAMMRQRLPLALEWEDQGLLRLSSMRYFCALPCTS